jgi:hypothetical protein
MRNRWKIKVGEICFGISVQCPNIMKYVPWPLAIDLSTQTIKGETHLLLMMVMIWCHRLVSTLCSLWSLRMYHCRNTLCTISTPVDGRTGSVKKGRPTVWSPFMHWAMWDRYTNLLHYRSHLLPRVPQALGEEPKTLVEAFPECNTRRRAFGEAAHGEELFPECQKSYTRGILPRVPR